MFQMLSSHLWLMAVVLNNAGLWKWGEILRIKNDLLEASLACETWATTALPQLPTLPAFHRKLRFIHALFLKKK